MKKKSKTMQKKRMVQSSKADLWKKLGKQDKLMSLVVQCIKEQRHLSMKECTKFMKCSNGAISNLCNKIRNREINPVRIEFVLVRREGSRDIRSLTIPTTLKDLKNVFRNRFLNAKTHTRMMTWHGKELVKTSKGVLIEFVSEGQKEVMKELLVA